MSNSACVLQESPPEVTIRRIPPAGIASQPCALQRVAMRVCSNRQQLTAAALLNAVCLRSCGPVAFQVPLEQVDKPSNILEEIVW